MLIARLTRSKPLRSRALLLTVIFTGLSAAGCELEGGLNDNQITPGNNQDGVDLKYGEIAIDPTGDFFISKTGDCLLHGELDRSTACTLPGISRPERLAFGGRGEIFVTTTSRGGKIVAYDVANRQVLWKLDADVDPYSEFGSLPRLEVSEDGRYLIAAQRTNVKIIDAVRGEVVRKDIFDRSIVDVDLHPDGDRVIVTLNHEWEGRVPTTKIAVISRAAGTVQTIEAPNCSDELIVAPDGKTVFLAPTTCTPPESSESHDPVSVIDLEKGEFVRNLPGFGPVAIAPDGSTLVAFMDMEALDESLFGELGEIPPATSSRYRLMFIRFADLKFESVEVGEQLPRYALTPDGRMLLVDSDTWFEDGRVRILNMDNKVISPVAGPDVRLESFVLTSDSKRALLLDSGLYELSIDAALVESIGLLFTPRNLNITPDDKRLLLRESDSRLWVYDVETRSVTHEIHTCAATD